MKLFEVKRNSIWTPSPRGDVDVEGKGLVTLKGAPLRVEGEFICSQNHLTSLQYAPQYVGKGIHAWNNKITSLQNIHKYIRYIGDVISLYDNPIQSHMLGLCLIKGLKEVQWDSEVDQRGPVDSIFDKYLHDINLCQEALIDAGYPQLAKL